jgi:hypothetical protein
MKTLIVVGALFLTVLSVSFSSDPRDTVPRQTPSVSHSTTEATVPPWLIGVWRCEWIERRGERSSPYLVRYLQTPSFFGDLRLRVDRPDLSRAASFDDLNDADLLVLARQRGFVGVTTVNGTTSTWRHEVDFQPLATKPDIGRLEQTGSGSWFEYALDGSYTELWHSVGSADGRALVIRVERGGRLSRTLMVAGDYFYFARNRAKDLPPAKSLETLITAKHASRSQVIEWLDCELSFGRVCGGRIAWEVEYSTLPWRVRCRLDFVDQVIAKGRNVILAPGAQADEVLSLTVNTLDEDDLTALFTSGARSRPQ